MSREIAIRYLSTIEETRLLDDKFARHFPWYKPGNYYVKCLEENREGRRVTLLAFFGDELAGCCHLLQRSYYPYFQENGIPKSKRYSIRS